MQRGAESSDSNKNPFSSKQSAVLPIAGTLEHIETQQAADFLINALEGNDGQLPIE
jgi:hypothetical protein